MGGTSVAELELVSLGAGSLSKMLGSAQNRAGVLR
jgi:hypothetical protein